jgi:hypothetical protein
MNNNFPNSQNKETLDYSEQRRPIAKLKLDQENSKAKNSSQSSSDNNPSKEQNHEK